ncbi:C1-like domain protein (macronuclear) [Tetrahymena thermophila SB210]|uniref:C1-like domain protein n=1 Tax=Tetrahymena thermophila (strain SB210) TaxID=312017 RepID=I7MED4_TETTS|nr:C1-like domain protein [Tetrahymena thermophila SB210]EAR96122.1 C1-like domain protein [Tetrahymena thermophila SB210]|eukprot:XP_001016367.1 C1-like domain protein [Tetrahymena thermophila SB210]
MEIAYSQVIQKKCFKHKNQNVSFLKINSEMNDCKLICSLCLNKIEGKFHIFDINQILNHDNVILPYWPLTKTDNDQDEILQIVQDLESQEQLSRISEMFKKLRSTFDYEVENLEKRFLNFRVDNILQKFYLGYKQAAQFEQLTNLLKEELDQKSQQQNVSEKLQKFIKSQNENNQVENLFQDLREFHKKQELSIDTLNQINKQLAFIFKNPFEIKYLQEQITLNNTETQSPQDTIELSSQISTQLIEEYKQELNILKNENNNLLQSLNDLQRICDSNQKSFNNLKEEYQNEGIALINNIDYYFKSESIKFNLHDHPLILTSVCQGNNKSAAFCSACGKKDILFSWHCQQCKYDICQICSSKNKFPQHMHELKLTTIPQRKYKGYTQCDICDDNHINVSWHCNQCKYDMCQTCSEKDQIFFQRTEQNIVNKNIFMNNIMRNFPLDIHQLKLTDSSQRNQGINSCNICNQRIIKYAWYCSECNNDICLSCSEKFKKFPQHCHELLFTNSSQRKYIYGAGCDNCQKVDLEYTWHCSLCQYDLCEKCCN